MQKAAERIKAQILSKIIQPHSWGHAHLKHCIPFVTTREFDMKTDRCLYTRIEEYSSQNASEIYIHIIICNEFKDTSLL